MRIPSIIGQTNECSARRDLNQNQNCKNSKSKNISTYLKNKSKPKVQSLTKEISLSKIKNKFSIIFNKNSYQQKKVQQSKEKLGHSYRGSKDLGINFRYYISKSKKDSRYQSLEKTNRTKINYKKKKIIEDLNISANPEYNMDGLKTSFSKRIYKNIALKRNKQTENSHQQLQNIKKLE